MSKRAPSLAELASVRAEIELAQAALERLELADLPRDEWRDRAHAWLARERATFERQFGNALTALRQPARPAIGCDGLMLGVSPQLGPKTMQTADAAPLLSWLLGDLLAERIEQAITASGEYAEGPRLKDRPAALEQARREIDRLELREELLIRELEQGGHEVDRRAEAPPALVLAWDRDLARQAA